MKSGNRSIRLKGSWRAKRHEPNSATLDYCRFKVGRVPWSRYLPVLRVQRYLSEGHLGEEFVVEYSFHNHLKQPFRNPVLLALESPARYDLRINGAPVRYRDEGWWVDPSFKVITITDLITDGKNSVQISGRFSEDTELESIYVIGNFGVEVAASQSPRLVGEREYVDPNDLAGQGYPFFTGTISLSREFHFEESPSKSYWLEIEGLRTAVATVTLNGRMQGVICWKPHRIGIRGVQKGRNLLEIGLTGTLRNLLGPHHDLRGDLSSVGPHSFSDEANWTDDYNFVANGFESVIIHPGECD